MTLSIMAECFKLSVANEPFMLSVLMLNVIILSVTWSELRAFYHCNEKGGKVS